MGWLDYSKLLTMKNLSSIRTDYTKSYLDENDLLVNPISQFIKWLDLAFQTKVQETNMMVLSTVSADGFPNSRAMLLKDVSDEGFFFFSNYLSVKGLELENNPKANLTFFWEEREQQVRVKGLVEKISREESVEYFNSRPSGSKISVCVSKQSSVVKDRQELEDKAQQLAANKSDKEIKCPEYWGGYILKPIEMEFWQGRANRLHDRLKYTLNNNGKWDITRLAP